jgi:hypothetical protein
MAPDGAELRTIFKADGGLVFLEGDPLPLTLTPDAALELAEQMMQAATLAFGQRAMIRIEHSLNDPDQTSNSDTSSSG